MLGLVTTISILWLILDGLHRFWFMIPVWIYMIIDLKELMDE